MRLATLLAIFVTVFSIQADVISWRNGGNGEYLNSRLPLNWSENILWKTPLENWSNASPIMVDGKLFVCEEPSTLVCIDSKNGNILWKRSNDLLDLLGFTEDEKREVEALKKQQVEIRNEINRLENNQRRLGRRLEREEDNETLRSSIEKIGVDIQNLQTKGKELLNDPKFGDALLAPTHPATGYTSYTPVSDGKLIYAAFGFGLVAAYDLHGNNIWSKQMDRPFDIQGYATGGSTSPLIVDDKLLVRFSDYTALDLKTGDKIWNIVSKPAYGTPLIFKVEGESFVFTPRGNVIRMRDGEKIQTGLVAMHPKEKYSAFTSPVIDKGIIYTVRGCHYNGNDGHAYAYRIPKDLEELYETGLEELWHTIVHEKNYFASPIVHEGLFYAICEGIVLSVLDANSGEIIYERKIDGLKGVPYPSLTLAKNAVFFGSDDGTAIKLQPGREYKEIARSRLERFRSTPIFVNNVAYLRTYENLYAIKAN